MQNLTCLCITPIALGVALQEAMNRSRCKFSPACCTKCVTPLVKTVQSCNYCCCILALRMYCSVFNLVHKPEQVLSMPSTRFQFKPTTSRAASQANARFHTSLLTQQGEQTINYHLLGHISQALLTPYYIEPSLRQCTGLFAQLKHFVLAV